MKNTHRKFTSFLIFADLIIVLAGILLKIFLEDAVWQNLIALIAVFSALLSLSDLYKKSADDQRNLSILSASVIDPLFNRYMGEGLFKTSDGSDMTKMSFSGDYDFNQNLRNVTDTKERALMELVWEHQCNKKRIRRSRTNAVLRTVLLILAVLLLAGGLVLLFVFPQYFPPLSPSILQVITLCSFVFVLAVAYANSGNFACLQKMQTILGLRDRCSALDENKLAVVKPEPTPAPQVVIPVQVAVPAQPVVSTPVIVDPVQESPVQASPVDTPSPEPEMGTAPDTGEKEWKPIDAD